MSPPATPRAVWLGAATLALLLHAAALWLLARSADEPPSSPPRIAIERVAVEPERAAANAAAPRSVAPRSKALPAAAPSAPAASAKPARSAVIRDAAVAPPASAAEAEAVRADAATTAPAAVAGSAPSATSVSGQKLAVTGPHAPRAAAARLAPGRRAQAEPTAATTAPTATARPATAADVDAGDAPSPAPVTPAAAPVGVDAPTVAPARAATGTGRGRAGTAVSSVAEARAVDATATAAEPAPGDASTVVAPDPASAGARSSPAAPTLAGRPPTPAPAAAAVRPQTVVADVVADLNCADVALEDGRRGWRVVGFVDSADARARVAAAVRRALSTLPVAVDLEVHAPPFCAVVAPLADDGGVAIALNQSDAVYRAGEFLVLDVTVEAPKGGYLYVDFVDHTGTVFHLLPRPGERPPAVEPGETLRVGGDFWEVSRGGDGFVIQPPFGRGLVVARLLDAAAEGWSPPTGEQAVARFVSAAAAAGDVRAAGWRYLQTRPAR